MSKVFLVKLQGTLLDEIITHYRHSWRNNYSLQAFLEFKDLYVQYLVTFTSLALFYHTILGLMIAIEICAYNIFVIFLHWADVFTVRRTPCKICI